MINVIQTAKGETLFSLWTKAVDACKDKPKLPNLILSGIFPISEIHSEWIGSHRNFALDLQNPVKPNKLELNHGQFIDRYKSEYNKSGLEYIIEELKTKPDSNRACWSLYDMSTLFDSDDKSIPSFMVLQAAISEDNEILSITTYYRALEVSKYLPRNIAESCLVAERLEKEFSYSFKQFSLTIHAFNAYVKENYSCHEKAKLDLLSDGDIAIEIVTAATSKKWLKEHLADKRDRVESRINHQGIEFLIKNIEAYNIKPKDQQAMVYEKYLINKLKSILKKINEHNEIVYTRTYTVRAQNKYIEIKKEIDEAIALL